MFTIFNFVLLNYVLNLITDNSITKITAKLSIKNVNKPHDIETPQIQDSLRHINILILPTIRHPQPK